MPSRAQRVVIFALILATGMSYYYFALLIPHVREVRAHRALGGGYYFGSDFYPIWWTTRQLIEHKQNPYSEETTRQIQIALFRRALDGRLPGDPPPNYHAFSYPLYTDSLAFPLAWMSFPLARITLCFLLPLQVALAVLLWLRAIGPSVSRPLQAAIVILVMISYPALEAMFLEQASVAVTIALAAMTWALSRGKLALAGTFLALSWVKPHLVILLSIWLMAWAAMDWGRRKALVMSFGITLATLLSASEVVMPGWFSAWIASLVEYRHYTEPPLVWFVPGHWIGTTAAVTLLLLALLIGASALRRPASSSYFQFALAFLLAVTVVTLPSGNAVYEQLLLLPGIIWLGAHRRHWAGHPPSVLLATLALIVVIWPPAIGTLVAVASWFAPAVRHNLTALALPLRTAASFPFVLLAVLSLSRFRILSGHSDRVVPPRAPAQSVDTRWPSKTRKASLLLAARGIRPAALAPKWLFFRTDSPCRNCLIASIRS